MADPRNARIWKLDRDIIELSLVVDTPLVPGGRQSAIIRADRLPAGLREKVWP